MYILKDNNNNFLRDDSLFYDGELKKWLYISYEKFCDAIFYYQDLNAIEKIINNLETLALKINFDIKFHIEKIDLETIMKDMIFFPRSTVKVKEIN